MSTILVRFIVRQVLLRSIQLLAGFILLYTAIDYVETASLVSSDVLHRFYLYKLPQTISHVLPLALGLGAVLTANQMKQSGEWTALEATGIPPAWLFFILLWPSLILVPAEWCLVHEWSPASVATFDNAVAGTPPSDTLCQKADGWLIFTIHSDSAAKEVQIQRSDAGRTRQLIVRDTKTNTQVFQWTRQDDDKPVAPSSNQSVAISMPAMSINGIFAAAVTSSQLRRHAQRLSNHGVSAARVKAALSLRHGLVMTFWCVPLLALVLWGKLGIVSSIRSVWVSLAVAAVYWASLQLWWNWAQHGGIPAWTIALSMLGGTGVLLGTAALIRSHPR
ncbi:MAG: LptF/LptG family permease [Deltaproteobacteria bacterium]|nr:LptF/LptG family permease [Deltaproteobacteria bacterium]MBN2671522.1 LptF/LptG family permease [Deltaproteobacteria bacterium]